MVATGLNSEYSQHADTWYNRGIIASSKLILYWWIGNGPNNPTPCPNYQHGWGSLGRLTKRDVFTSAALAF